MFIREDLLTILTGFESPRVIAHDPERLESALHETLGRCGRPSEDIDYFRPISSSGLLPRGFGAAIWKNHDRVLLLDYRTPAEVAADKERYGEQPGATIAERTSA